MKTRKIDIYVNDIYMYSTTRFSTLKAAKKSLYLLGYAVIASVPNNIIYNYKNGDKITAKFSV